MGAALAALTQPASLCPPGGRGCCRTPWESPSVCTCSKQSACPRLRCFGYIPVWEVLFFFFKIYFGFKTLPCVCWQACTLLLSVLFIYDVFFVFITPFLTNVRCGGFAGRVSVHLVRLTLTLVCVCVPPPSRAGRVSWWRSRLVPLIPPRMKR